MAAVDNIVPVDTQAVPVSEEPQASTSDVCCSDDGDDNTSSDDPPLCSTFVAIPTTDKQVFKQIEEDFNRFDCNMEVNLGNVNALCFEHLVPQKNWEEMVRERRFIAKKTQAIRSAVADVNHCIEDLKLGLMCCAFRLPETVITQDCPNYLVSMSSQQVENMLKRKRKNEFAGKVEAKRRTYSEYALHGGKVLPKTDEAIENYIDILTRLSLVDDLAEKIEFPEKKALQDVKSLKKWFKEVNTSGNNCAHAYVRLCVAVKEREQSARARFERGLISEKKLNQVLNVAQTANVKSLLKNGFVRLIRRVTPPAEKQTKSKKDKK